jgi:glycosyltransferase involved in cell wall biosynthesis
LASKPLEDRVLILTQSFIKFRGDILSKHIFVAAKLLNGANWKVSVLAPHEKGLARHELIQWVEIFRFRYFLEKWERLAYTGRMQELVVKNPFNLLVLFPLFLYRFLHAGSQLALRKRPSCIHAHWWIPTGVLGCVLSGLRNLPLLVTLHGTDVRLIGRNLLFSSLAKWVLEHAAGITVVSDFIKAQLTGKLGVAPEKIFVLPMPIDPEKIYQMEVPVSERKMILCVARLTKQKDLATLIRAFHLVLQKRDKLDLVIIGEGPEKANLQALIRDLGLEEEVFLYDLMPQETLNQYYNQCDMVILPSIDEGFGLVVLEGQLCRKPVIGANSGGIPEIIEHGETGLLFPPGDHESLASAVEEVLGDKKLASRLSEAGHRSAGARFSQEAFLKKYVEVLRWIQRRY